MIHIQLTNQFQKILSEHDRAALVLAARKTIDLQDASRKVEMTIRITDDDEIRALNRQFLGDDSPTDVLSFPGGEMDPDSQNLYLGDVVISCPRALTQADAGGHPLLDELRLLVVHGVLHLLGYDHAQEQERTAMWAVQAKALASLGATITGPAS